MATLTGQITVKVDGETLFSKSGQATFSFGGKELTAQYADNRLIGFTQKPVGAVVSGSLQHMSDTDFRALAEHDNVSIVIETDTGKSYLIQGASATKPPELSGENGDVSFEYMGQPAVEV
jgi:hypothetical protein